LGSHSISRSPVFVCPRCGKDRYRLHEVDGVWACRECHKLDYSSRHTNRSVPGLARLLLLRKWIGASPQPFSPLPEPPRRKRHYVAEIAALESGLIKHLGSVNSDLKRRIKSRKAKRTW